MSGQPLYERDPEAWYRHLAEGNARQPRKRVSVEALIRDEAGRILIVKPTYKPGWDVPGGMVESNEPPFEGLRRELAEELDLRLPACALLCIDWVSPHGPWDDLLVFVFNGGVLRQAECERLELHDEELSEYQFIEATQLGEMLRPRLWRRVRPALEALRTGAVRYLQDGEDRE